jgi:hypothetical protein
MTRRALLAGLLPAVVPAQTRAPGLVPLDASQPIAYNIGPGKEAPGFRPGDPTLAEWALAAWGRASGGVLRFRRAAEAEALLRIYWEGGRAGLYGEMVPIRVNGRHGAAVLVLPDTEALGADIAAEARRDPLFRDTVVYLTCLHETGHGLGLAHTSDYADIMFFFGYGGDIPGFFRRYRRRLMSREDIPKNSGLSEADITRVQGLYRK